MSRTDAARTTDVGSMATWEPCLGRLGWVSAPRGIWSVATRKSGSSLGPSVLMTPHVHDSSLSFVPGSDSTNK